MRRSAAASSVGARISPAAAPRNRNAAAPAIGVIAYRVLWIVIGAVVIVTPLVFDRFGKDIFRLPKELVFRAQAIVIVTVGTIAALFGHVRLPRTLLRDWIVLMAGAIVAWTVITTLFSTNRALSVWSAGWVIAGVVFGLTVYLISARAPLSTVNLLFVAAVPNCCMYLLQEFRMWNPFAGEDYIQEAHVNRHLFSTGMVGNPDDLASYLLVPALAAAVMSGISSHRAGRIAYIALSAFFGVTLIATQSWAAIGAYIVAMTLRFTVTTRRPIVPIALLLMAVAAVITTYAPFRYRLVNVMSALRAPEIDAYSIDLLLSNRLVPFAAAVQMASSHPLTGVGPGSFGWQYYAHKVMLDNAHPDLRRSSGAWWMFGEAHSDHLQTLAVAGIPGYVLFCASLVLLASCSRGIRAAAREQRLRNDRQSFALLLSFPLAAAFGVLTLALFPLELAAPTAVTLYAAALCASWKPHAEERH